MLNYALNKYTWANALCWGNFLGHCKKALQSRGSSRFVHIIIAIAEALPLIGQIASIFEKMVVAKFDKPTLPQPLKPLTPDRVVIDKDTPKDSKPTVLIAPSKENVKDTKTESAIKIQTNSKSLEKQRTTAAVKIQNCYRKFLAKKKLKALKNANSERLKVLLIEEKQQHDNIAKSVTIVDAKDAGIKYEDVKTAIGTITSKELKEDEGDLAVTSYVDRNYFEGKPIAPGRGAPETILLAKASDKVVGFLITLKHEQTEDSSILADACYVSYLAVDSTFKRYGIGTKLMLAAMRKTKELGKRYLTLEYIIDQERGQAKKKFYSSFKTRFGIPTEERNNIMLARKIHAYPYYDLQNVDVNSLKAI